MRYNPTDAGTGQCDIRYVQKTFTFSFFWTTQKLTDFNNFGVLCPEKIWHEHLTPLSTSPVRCSCFTFGNPKSQFSTVLFILQIICVISKQNKLQLLYYSLAVYWLLFSASHYLHSPITASGARYRRSACIEYQSAIRTSCGSGLLQHGLNFSTAWYAMRLISDEKYWKNVSMQKVTTLNTSCDDASLTFQLPHITTGSCQSHQHLKERNKPSIRWKSLAFHKMGWASGLQFSLFSSEITYIIRSLYE